MGLCLSKRALTLTEKEEIYIIEAEQEVMNKGLNGINEFYNNQIEKWHRELSPLHVGLLGLSGSEKSSFINALTGFEDGHDNSTDASPTERTKLISDKKKKKNPAIYRYAKNKNIIFWDLPDIKTLTCSSSSCLCCSVSCSISCCLPSRCCFGCDESPCAENFDAFVIFVKSRISDIEKKIAENVSKNLRKPFIFVCTLAEDDKKNVKKDKEAMLKKIKTICFDFVKDMVMDESDIFVIDSKFMNKNLIEDIILKLMKRRKDLFVNYLNYAIFVNTKDTKKIFQQAQKHGVDNILDFYSNDSIPLWTDTEINFAITGDSGTGKSSFINAVRGIEAHAKEAAPVGVTEMTNKPTRYSHPKHENIIFWDLPGIGTPKYPNYKEYYKKVGGLEKYDAFLIFCKTRFTQNDKVLAEKVSKELKKPFFFVRTNIDSELKNAKDDEGPKFDEASVMKRMRENCLKSLGDSLHDEKDIFLIDNKITEKYDFQGLKESIAEALSKGKKKSFVDSLEKLTHTIIRIKANILKDELSKVIVLLMIAESEPEVFKNLILQEVIRYHRVFVQLGKKEEELLKNEHLKEIEQELKKEMSVRNSTDEENIEERKPESVGNSLDEKNIEERKPESVGNSIDEESIEERKPKSVGNSTDEENIEERKPESVGNSIDEENIEKRKPESVGNSIDEEIIEEKKPESVGNSIDEENSEERKPESVGNSIDEENSEERKPESVGNSPAKVQWAYNYLIDCINNLENQLACKN
ncbi:uncharacterized protein LOC124437781 isoform X2 [Xenia sp. Carnegie-2017]|uniref:uncharacterized protein LOC124437781 isoform X2 n=1 Tax=Xenia sp. Carnegie-2017 TaxID=2897299 RepID=UPI001F033A32|nr:uncharacterized protein LOC124437781 isoform X2 [Xenia sp. Carnegie-2017]